MKISTLLLALLVSFSFSFGQNLIENGDFEMPGTSADPVPAPWGGFKNRIVNDSTVNSFVGQVENGDGSLFQEFSVTPGDTFDVVFNYKWVNSGAANTNLTVRIKDANDLPNNLDLIGGTIANGYKLNTDVDQWFFKTRFSFVPPTGIDSVRILFFKGNGNKSLNLDSVSVTLRVPCTNPVSAFSISDTNDLALTFDNQSTGTGSLGYSWDFGDGNTSIDAAPTHTFDTAGTYVICLTATDECGSVSSCDTVTVAGAPCTDPVAAFAVTDTNDLALQFSNQSTGEADLAYSWDFGDGNMSSDAAPSHTFDSAGTYVICLTITDGCGNASVCDTVTLSAAPTSISSALPYSLSLYPNPVNDLLTLKAGGTLDRVEMVSLLGRLVLTVTPNSHRVQLDVQALPAGIYFVRAYADKSVGTFRITKK